MKPKVDSATKNRQTELFPDSRPVLSDFIDLRHPLVLMADRIEWEVFDRYWDQQFSVAGGPQASPGRLVSGLLMLKHMEAFSDERLMEAWVSNPYYQYFCGETRFQHKPPADPTSLTHWRQRLDEEGLEWILTMVLESAVKSDALEKQSMAHLCVDSTVMEKHIAHPTDSQLLEKCRIKLVEIIKRNSLTLRQSYARQGPRLSQQIGRYAHAKQFKRMRRGIKKQSTWVGRLTRELKRQLNQLPESQRRLAEALIAQAQQLTYQAKHPASKHKLYALHEPKVDCISKGKAHKRYEFGTKVGIACTQKEGFVIGIRSFPGNPYDGHTLDEQLEQAETLSGVQAKTVAVDLGYRGRHATSADIIHRGRKLSKRQKQRLKRRSMIEAMIGHMKNEGLMGRCHLKGLKGDACHAILCGIGHNLRLFRNFIRQLFFWLRTAYMHGAMMMIMALGGYKMLIGPRITA